MNAATERTGKYSALKVYTEESMCVCLYTQEENVGVLVKMSGSNSCTQAELCRFFTDLRQSDHGLFPHMHICISRCV